MQKCPLSALAVVILTAAMVSPLGAQTAPACRFLCSPTLTLMPGVIHTHLFGGPTVRTLSNNQESKLPSSTAMEIILATAMKTPFKRLGVFASVQWLPNESEKRNPFTLYTASELGGPVRANAATATFGATISMLTPDDVHGWADLGVNVGDLFSQAARPDDRSAYTHKLDLALIGHAYPFAKIPKHVWVHGVGIYGIFDYVATGLPKAGDQVPQGRVFVTNARPAALIVGLSLPIAE